MPADLLSEVLIVVHLLSARDRVRPERKSTRRSLLDEDTRKVSTFSTMTVVPLIETSTAVDNQKSCFIF